jgi:hypothetical protein
MMPRHRFRRASAVRRFALASYTKGKIRMRLHVIFGPKRHIELPFVAFVLLCLALGGAVPFDGDRDSKKREAAKDERAAGTALTGIEERLKEEVSYLAADEREGRAPGTKGIEAAALYIAGAFKQLGLKPAPGAQGYYQPFSISGRAVLKDTQELAFGGPDGNTLAGAVKTDFMPLGLGISGSLKKVPVVFAGYGITAKDEARKLDYDDYAGIDVKGKAVLIIRREPQQKDGSSFASGRRESPYATFRHKASNAFQHGAIAVLFVNDLAGLGGKADSLLSFNAGGFEVLSNLPFVMLSRELADKLLSAAGEPSLDDLEKQIASDLKPRSRELKDWTVTARIEIDRPGIETKNVIGVLEGAGPLADETVIIGGHYDHLGRGGMMSGSLAFLSRDIHNGADDNASGTTMVLEMARRLAARPDPLPRRVVFMAFSGEERGLLGSRYYVEHPLIPLSSTVMMINCDMVGRLNTQNELTMIGTGTTPGIDTLVDVLGKSAGLTIKKVAGSTLSFGDSDHHSFYLKGIPVLFAFTGVHADYHRPSDDSDRINYGGMARIADFLELILLDIARRPERPVFVQVKQPVRAAGGNDPGRSGMSVYLGTMPDYADESKNGLKLAGVREGSPADKGGLKQGDVITRFGDKPVGTIYDYMEIMGQHKPGDKVDLVVQRDGKELKLRVTLGSRSRE